LTLAPDGERGRTVISTFKIAPRLRHISLHRDFQMHDFTLPWSQITHLDITFMSSVQECLGILALCSKLEHCSINIIMDAVVSVRQTVKLPRLHFLSIYTDRDISALFRYLTLPSLQTLELRHDYEIAGIPWPRTELELLIHRSSCTLKRLVLHEVTMIEADMIACLALIPSLVEFEVNHYCAPYITDDVLLMLTHGCGPPAEPTDFLAPRLEVITFMGDLSFDENVLADMVESRWHISYKFWSEEATKVSRLRELSLSVIEEMKPEAVVRLKRYEDEGLKFSML
jgi:hypothetical protein